MSQANDGVVADPASPVEMDDAALHDAIAVANIPVLLMVLHHLTGDERWLADPYAPTRARGLSDHDTGGLPQHVQAEIREAAEHAVRDWAQGVPPVIGHPSPERLQQMLSVCVAEDVPAEYARLMLVEMGFEREPVSAVEVNPHSVPEDVLIVGAGLSGLALGIRLDQAGIPYTIVEKNDDVGGTWLENRYPGAGVDTPSYLYSLSFFPRNWSTYFGKRDEVLRYLHEVADHFGLRDRVRFKTEVQEAVWDDDAQRWRVQLRNPDGSSDEVVVRYLVTAVGLLSRPKVPTLPGMGDFGGPLFHSARWPEGLDVSGKRVAVVGSGASAMQIVPAIAAHAGHVTIFQRSPQWVAPAENYFTPVPPQVHWLMRHVPYYHRWYRFRLAWLFNDRVWPSLQIDPDWPHRERSLNAVNDAHRKYFTAHLRRELDDREDLVDKTLPTYPPYGKRILLDNGWYAALRRPNVELVTEAVSEVTPTGLRTSSGAEHEADVVVLCTGFETQRLLHPMDIRGRDGRSIRDDWGEDDPHAYLGVTTPGFPNLAFMYGPNTNPGGGSYMFIAECQAQYIADLLSKAIEAGVGSVECRRDVHDEFNREVDEQHARMVWSHPGMETYYRNPAGRVVTNWPWRVVDYWERTRTADLDDFVLEPAREAVPADR
jgi:4-hydroxyacetophenone monooxygenase